MTIAATVALNHTGTRRSTNVDIDPFPLQTKREYLEELHKSEEDFRCGRVQDAKIVMTRLAKKYGF